MAYEWWKKPLLDESYDWSWSDDSYDSYDYGADEDMFSSYDALPDETQEGTTSQYGNVIPNPLYNEGFGGEASFLNMSESGWEDFELGQGDYAGTWETEEERKALEDDYSWWDSIDDAKKSALGTISSALGGVPIDKIGAFFKGMSGGGAGGQAQRQQQAGGVSQRRRMPTQSGGGPTRMTKAQATQSAAARIQAAGGSSRGNAAAQLMARTNARVNNANNLRGIVDAALSDQKGQKTIALSSALRQLKLPRYSA